jgi:hypothetical protein
MVLFGTVFHTICYLYVVPYIFSQISGKYREILKRQAAPGASTSSNLRKQRAEWDSRGVSTTHAMITFLLACYCIFYEGLAFDYHLTDSSKAVVYTLTFSLGYFIYDLVLTAYNFPNEYGMIGHHIIALVCFSISTLYATGFLFCMFFLFTGKSTL